MDYSVFVKSATLHYKQNVFKKYNGNLNAIPDELKPFYRDYNPVDVEINCNGVAIKFYPVEKLTSLQKEYSYLNAQFIFATCNADPIFLHGGHIYTCPNGVKNPEWEQLSIDIEQYFLSLI